MARQRVSKVLIHASFVAGLAPSAADAGAWLLPEGDSQVITSLSYSQAGQSFGRGGQTRDRPTYRKAEISPYMEHGLRDWLTLVFQPSFQQVDDPGARGGRGLDDQGLANLQVGARLPVASTEDTVLTIQPAVIIAGEIDRASNPALGNSGTDYELRALAGYSFTLLGLPSYLDAQTAYRARSGNPGEIRTDVSLGIKLGTDWEVLAQSFNTLGYEGNEQDFRYNKLQISALHHLSGAWSVQLGATQTVAGSQALEESGGFLSIWHRF